MSILLYAVCIGFSLYILYRLVDLLVERIPTGYEDESGYHNGEPGQIPNTGKGKGEK